MPRNYRPFVLPDADLVRSAKGMIRNFGADAEAKARAMAERMKSEHDPYGEECWGKIAKEIARRR
jgi:hypothetical protein